ncbi:MAG TPA: S-adenosylmethionine:tRNA ribosyltransferase-isomerase [Candidatus Solibacter sp.]|nr:S-adenosylmethionine:tRNA ribosyltransferase-isomerase [Candidatus Solibacter sp.]
MLAAHLPYQRYPAAKLLAADREGALRHVARARFADLLRPGDLVVANDAATMPASLAGQHAATGEPVEVRLAGRGSLAADDVCRFSAVVFGAGDFHQRTEDRPLPPALGAGDLLVLGPLRAVVEKVLRHPRLIALRLEGTPDEIWAGLARHGRPIQYAHVPAPLALWDVWTPIAGPPVAFEPPSSGFAIDWRMLGSLAARGAGFATVTHAAGISSTGDAELDGLLPFDEPYRIPGAAAEAIRRARESGGRVIAIGTTVVRALEHRASGDGCVRAGEGLATQRIGAESRLRVVDAILSGTHEPGTSHYELLRAFADDATLRRMEGELEARGYRTHEFGDSVFLERQGDYRNTPAVRRSLTKRGSERSGSKAGSLERSPVAQCSP